MKEGINLSVDKIRNQFAYKVWGRYALFSDPITRMGGEKLSYPIPTYQALKGITESLYWEPSIYHSIEEVCVKNPSATSSRRTRSPYTPIWSILSTSCAHILSPTLIGPSPI